MRLIAAALPLVAAFALSACNSEPKQPKTPEQVMAEAGKLAKPQPGKYETSVELIDFSVPGLPPQRADMMKQRMRNVVGQGETYCLTKEEADKGFEEMVRKLGEGEGGLKCTFDKFDVNGDALDAAMTCTGQQGMTSAMKMDGTVSTTSTSMHMDMTQKAAAIPGGEMHMELKMDSKRIGACS
ncbi:DUF3617 domain-containing protein [Tsuneonella mangrovi]|uniref:DUF3617 domain-containing protein n=1 Tax=Tsuneonella mangrovi TaxID=1982042 RepID=UPI000BA26D3F|nr:DUF3617 domain-containing protein [Tsuneonella mangrovi]